MDAPPTGIAVCQDGEGKADGTGKGRFPRAHAAHAPKRLEVRPVALGHQQRHGKIPFQQRGYRRRSTGLQRVIGIVDGRGQPIVPGEPQQVGELGHRFRGKGGFSRGKPFGGQKYAADRTGIITSGRQQERIPQCVLVLAATHQPDSDGGTFQGLPRTPTSSPDGRGAD